MIISDFVRAECANFQSNGSCSGVWINDDLTITRCDPKPRCLVLEGRACPYLETMVLPIARSARDARRATEFQQAASAYHRGVEVSRASRGKEAAPIPRK